MLRFDRSGSLMMLGCMASTSFRPSRGHEKVSYVWVKSCRVSQTSKPSKPVHAMQRAQESERKSPEISTARLGPEESLQSETEHGFLKRSCGAGVQVCNSRLAPARKLSSRGRGLGAGSLAGKACGKMLQFFSLAGSLQHCTPCTGDF